MLDLTQRLPIVTELVQNGNMTAEEYLDYVSEALQKNKGLLELRQDIVIHIR